MGSSLGKHRFMFKGVVGYRRYMKYIYELATIQKHSEVKERLKALNFWNEYGLKATMDAFEISRPTLFRWKKLFISSRKSPYS